MKREYIQLKKYILVKFKKEFHIINNDYLANFNSLHGTESVYRCNKNNLKVYEIKNMYYTNYDFCPPVRDFDTIKTYVGKFIATSDNKEELDLFQK